jgi:GC-rich sequence DNA-binding factor
MLIKSLTPPFREAIEATRALILPSLNPHNPPPAFDPASVKYRRRFLIRRTKLLMNLIAWRKVIDELPEIDELIRKLLVDVMLPIAQSGWDVGGQEIMSKVNTLHGRSHR